MILADPPLPVDATVFVVDDDPAARDSVCALVSSKGLKAKSYATAEGFLADYDPQSPGCLVLDYRMPGMNGLELQKNLAQRGSVLPVIVMTAFANVPLTVEAMEGGVFTLIEKSDMNCGLWGKIERALANNAEALRRRLWREEMDRRLATLTLEETRVLELLVAGRSNKQIAAELGLGLRTAELRRSRVMEKTAANSLPELVRIVLTVQGLPGTIQTNGAVCGTPYDSSQNV